MATNDASGGFQLMVAPLQGFTEAPWRHAHSRLFGAEQGTVEYFTPFVRVEKGQVRARDLRDFTSDLNANHFVTPQIIFKDVAEWQLLVDELINAGASRIDMNLGCPFVLQVRKGRGAGMLGRLDELARIADAMKAFQGEVAFSVKMRLGIHQPTEAIEMADLLNSMALRHITIHPRTADQQYKGDLHLVELEEFAEKLHHPLIFNGEITSPTDLDRLTSKFAGAMVGRGLLRRPSLFAEYRTGQEWEDSRREEAFLNLIHATADLLSERLCGPAQLRDKLTPYWDYPPPTLNKKIIKQGKKGRGL